MALHILIVDADRAAAQVTRAAVARSLPAATVTVTTDPAHAWPRSQPEPLDVLIIDPPPRRPAGTQLIRQVQAIWPDVLVIVLASAPTPALRRDLRELAVDAYLEKPTLLPAVLSALRTALQGAHHACVD
jgi:DNA-binding NarL/FixJ family response regulator